MLRPAFLMDIDGTSGAVVDVGSGILLTDWALHCYHLRANSEGYN